MKHTQGNWQFKPFFGDDAFIEQQKSMGIQPTRILMNDGSCGIICDDTHIANVTCQSRFKRGEGSTAVCEERDANARLIAASPRLLNALRAMLELCPSAPMPLVDGDEIVHDHPAIAAAKSVIAEVEGK